MSKGVYVKNEELPITAAQAVNAVIEYHRGQVMDKDRCDDMKQFQSAAAKAAAAMEIIRAILSCIENADHRNALRAAIDSRVNDMMQGLFFKL